MPWERLHKVVSSMAGSEKPLKERLGAAHLEFMPLKPGDFPEESQEDFIQLMDQLDGLNAMDNVEAHGCIELIVRIYDHVARHKGPF